MPYGSTILTVQYGQFSAGLAMDHLKLNNIVGFGLAGLGLVACASVPELGKEPAPRAVTQISQSLAAPPTEWPSDEWWHAYADPQLDALIAEALKGAPSLAQAQARVAKAQAVAGETRATLYPTLEADGNYAEVKESLNQGFPPQFSQYLPRGYNSSAYLALKFGYEFDFWGKNRAAIAAATSEVRASQADAAEARLALSSAMALAYSDLGRLYAEHDVDERSAQVKEETAALVQRRMDNGLDTRATLKEAEAGVPAARAQLAAVDEEIAHTKNRIAALMGAGPDRGIEITRPTGAHLRAFGMPQQLQAQLLGRRPDIVGARWRAEEAAKRIHVARAEFYPNINLSAYIGQQALFAHLLFKDSSQIGSVGPAVTLPIFEGGLLRDQYRGARADYDAAVASYDATLVQALQELADAAASERALDVRLSESRAALAADEEAYKLIRMRYEGGLAAYQTVLIAEDAVLQARITVADLDARAFTLDVQLVQALGGGYVAS
jgi:NodT family efflux transporter outer membrane factor (OMF) lipoprotein